MYVKALFSGILMTESGGCLNLVSQRSQSSREATVSEGFPNTTVNVSRCTLGWTCVLSPSYAQPTICSVYPDV